jgi:hypothetical protein
MNLKLKLILGILILLVLKINAQKSEQLKWMIGSWKINTGNGIILEEWKIKDDSTFIGTSVFIKKGVDTIPQESIELSFRNGDWFYTPTVASQNNAQAIPFRVIFIKGTEFISENPEHDFPQRISYRRINTQLFASIEGRKNAKFAKMNFDFSSE